LSVPPAVLAQYQSVNQTAETAAQTPFQQYGGEFVAPVNSEQSSGITGTNAAATEAQPYYAAGIGALSDTQAATNPINQAATGLAANSSSLNGSDVNNFLSPYLGDVLGSTEALQNQSNQQAQAGQLGNAITSGAFGSDRTGIAAANLQQQEDLANSNVIAGIANTGYQSALGAAQTEQGIGLQGASTLAGIGSTAYGEGANTASELGTLGSGEQTAALTGAQAQIAAGTVEQQTQQAQDTAEYNQFLQQQSYPFQVSQFLTNTAEGTGALSGSTTTTQQPGGFFSDRRLKRDIRKIGETFDGQPIYSYKMGDDERTRVGLIAQNVEKKHPDAVGVAGGFKMVDYGRATEAAANRGHFYSGGVVPIRRARAVGGGLDDVLSAQQQMYAGIGGPNRQREIAQGNGGSHQLAVAQGSPGQAPNGASQVQQGMGLVNDANKLYKMYAKPSTGGVAGNGAAAPSAAGPQASGATTFADPSAVATEQPAAGAWEAAPAAGADTTAAAGATSAAAPAATDAAATAAGSAAAGAAGDAAVTGAADAAAALAAEYAAADVGAAVLLAKRGGRIKRDIGGGTPYDQGNDLSIPNDANQYSLAKPGPLVKQKTGLQTLSYMGDPNNAGTLGSSMFSNSALARGGVAARRGYDTGGAPDDPDNLQAGDTGEAPDGGLADAVMAAAPTSSGVAASPLDSLPMSSGTSTDDQKQSLWDKVKGSELGKAQNWVPLLSAISAMGTDKTRSLGVALAAGLGAGANSYMDTQTTQAKNQQTQALTQGDVLQNQMQAMQNAAAKKWLTPGATAPVAVSNPVSGAQPSDQGAAAAQNLDQYYRTKNYVPPILPQEAADMQTAAGAAIALKSDVPVQQMQRQIAQRVTAQTSANQNSAQQHADQLHDIYVDPTTDPVTKAAALAKYNANFQWTGDKNEDRGGNMFNSRTDQPAIGTQVQTLNPAQRAGLQIQEASPVSTGAVATTPLRDFAAQHGAPLPAVGSAAPGAQPVAGTTPRSAPPQASANFNDAPQKPAWLSDPTHIVTDEEKPVADAYGKADIALRDDASHLQDTQRSIIQAKRVLSELPNAKTGPGTDTMAAVQTVLGNMTGSQFANWVDQNPSARAMLEKTLGSNSLNTQLKSLRDNGAEIRLGQMESNLIMNKISASAQMPKDAIASLMNYQIQDGQYQAHRQAAIPAYLAQQRDPTLFDSYWSGKHPLEQSLSTAAPAGTTLAKPVAGVPTAAPADKGGFSPGQKYKDAHGNVATYVGNGMWK
jgi:hypothetical protein